MKRHRRTRHAPSHLVHCSSAQLRNAHFNRRKATALQLKAQKKLP